MAETMKEKSIYEKIMGYFNNGEIKKIQEVNLDGMVLHEWYPKEIVRNRNAITSFGKANPESINKITIRIKCEDETKKENIIFLESLFNENWNFTIFERKNYVDLTIDEIVSVYENNMVVKHFKIKSTPMTENDIDINEIKDRIKKLETQEEELDKSIDSKKALSSKLLNEIAKMKEVIQKHIPTKNKTVSLIENILSGIVREADDLLAYIIYDLAETYIDDDVVHKARKRKKDIMEIQKGIKKFPYKVYLLNRNGKDKYIIVENDGTFRSNFFEYESIIKKPETIRQELEYFKAQFEKQ